MAAKKKAPVKKAGSEVNSKHIDAIIRLREEPILEQNASLKTAVAQRDGIINALTALIQSRWQQETGSELHIHPNWTEGGIITKNDFEALSNFVGYLADEKWDGAKFYEKELKKGCGVKPVKPQKTMSVSTYMAAAKLISGLPTSKLKAKKK